MIRADDDQQSQETPKPIKLLEGRNILPLHHEDFLSELHHFELKGQTPTEEYIRRSSFGAFLYHRPEEALAALTSGIGLAVVTLARSYSYPLHSIERFIGNCQWIVRFHHANPQVRMMDVRTGMAYKFLTVKGHVVKARPKRLRTVTADFYCPKCGTNTTHSFTSGQYSIPTKCGNSGNKCRAKNFILQRHTARYINVQELRLQESQEESTTQAGRTPRQMEVHLTHELVGSCRPGDIVKVAAIVQAVNSAVAAGRAGKRAQETSTYTLYLQAHSVTTMSESRENQPEQGKNHQEQQQLQQQGSIVYTQQQLQQIIQLCHADHRYFGMTERMAFPFDLLVRSLCPSIIGHEMVKAGILLCLLGGTPPTEATSMGGTSIRSNSHLLICGDPGMGKSQMLLAATQVAARNVYVGGNTASTTGLTVSMTKEAGGEAGIEAGALVLADQGICCIDEFDKMAKTHQDGLLEAMEQQQISIAKAGVVASLPARCSVIAAANPKHGSYNLDQTVAENLNMATPILSRFDLVFILRDRADKEQDRLVASNIMNLHRGANQSDRPNVKGTDGKGSTNIPQSDNSRMGLKDRLEWVAQFQKQPLPAELVRDYISYAREYCKPVLTKDAGEVLKDYFMNLRYPADGASRHDTVPITTRQLEALIRLSQARAKACLREYVIREDALDVVELMSRSVDEIHKNEMGIVDRSRGGAGGISNRKLKKAFMNEIYRIVGAGNECSLDDLRRIAGKLNLPLHNFSTMVDNLRNEGILLKTSSNNYKVMSM